MTAAWLRADSRARALKSRALALCVNQRVHRSAAAEKPRRWLTRARLLGGLPGRLTMCKIPGHPSPRSTKGRSRVSTVRASRHSAVPELPLARPTGRHPRLRQVAGSPRLALRMSFGTGRRPVGDRDGSLPGAWGAPSTRQCRRGAARALRAAPTRLSPPG